MSAIPHDEFWEITPDKLEQLARTMKCECCGDSFGPTMRMSLSPKCHPGHPVYTQYWDGWLYVSCSECEKPIVKIKIKPEGKKGPFLWSRRTD